MNHRTLRQRDIEYLPSQISGSSIQTSTTATRRPSRYKKKTLADRHFSSIEQSKMITYTPSHHPTTTTTTCSQFSGISPIFNDFFISSSASSSQLANAKISTSSAKFKNQISAFARRAGAPVKNKVDITGYTKKITRTGCQFGVTELDDFGAPRV